MRTLIFILSAISFLLFTTCDEENPISANFSNGLRSIKLYNLDNKAVNKIQDINSPVYDCVFVDSTYFSYASFYSGLAELIVRDLRSYNYYDFYKGGGIPISGIQMYPESESIFFAADAIYLVKEYGKLVSKLANGVSPVFNPVTNVVMYSFWNNSTDYMIISQNLGTTSIDTLLKVGGKFLTLYFIKEDGSHLIYTEYDFSSGGLITLKSINLLNLNDIKFLTNPISSVRIGKNKSVNDKVAYVSEGTVYVLDLNAADLIPIATNAQFADISKDGQKVVYTTESELYTANSDGTNKQTLVNKTNENKYLFLPSFSSNDEQIVFIESHYKYGFDYEL